MQWWLFVLSSGNWNSITSPLPDIECLGNQCTLDFENGPRSDPCNVGVPSHQEAHTNVFREEQLLQSPQSFGIDPQLLALAAGQVDRSSPLPTLHFSSSPDSNEWAPLQTPSSVSATLQRSNPLPPNIGPLQSASPSASPGYSQSSTTSSPASVAPQLNCDFCMVSCINVDSLW